MSNVNANINITVNSQQAVSQLRSLQAQVAATNKSLVATGATAVAQQAALNKALMDGANASRMWNARIVPVTSSIEQFSQALDKGKMSLGQYTRYAASQLPGMSRIFRREFEMMTSVAEANVRRMNTQYVALGDSANGAARALALTPTALNRQAAATEIAVQRQMMMNRMIDLGTTKLLNWGKNTQWAGRQLMVGFSIPLAMMGAAAAKAFKEIDQSSIAFRRVYGDLQTTTAEMERNLDAVKALGEEYTKYGRSLSEVIQLGADVAATGARNNDLTAATEQTLRLATLGLMENGEALEAVTALQTAFQISSEDLAGTIDFLNVVENETILTMQDMAAAIPRVAPVIKGLGGDVKDLAVFMTAMREGGISAEQGANALKSGLGRLINPTKAAREQLEKFGINIDAIVQINKGDIMGTVQAFGDALATLDDFQQQQALQKVFGTYQYARLGALFKNIANDSGQAARTIELTGMSLEDLAKISERELGKIEDATSTKFAASIEKLKIAIAPIGETFMKALMPVIDFASKILNAFNDLPDGVKNAIAIAVGAIAGLGPVVLMTVGLIANGIANVGKLVQVIRKFMARLKGDASAFNYLTQEEQEATAAANSLSGATEGLTGKFVGQQQALQRLIELLGTYSSALANTAGAMPLGMGAGPRVVSTPGGGSVSIAPGARGSVVGPGGMRMAKGGVVPGKGDGDTVPAMLTPGEFVLNKDAVKEYGPLIQAMNAGTLKMLSEGGLVEEEAVTETRPRRYSTNDPAIRSQTAEFRESGMFRQEQRMLEETFGGRISESQLGGLTQLDASHMRKLVDELGNKIFDPEELKPELGAINNYYNRIEGSLKQMLSDSIETEKSFSMFGRETTLSAEIAQRTGMAQQEVYDELVQMRNGVAPATDRARNVAMSFAEIDEELTREALETKERRGLRTGPKTPIRTSSTTPEKDDAGRVVGHREQLYRPQAFRATMASLGARGFFGSPADVTYAGAMRRGAGATDTRAVAAAARQEAQTRNRVIEQESQDIAVLARDRNSPHAIVTPDAKADARQYANTIKQTLMSMTPMSTGKPLVTAAPPNVQGSQSLGAAAQNAQDIKNMILGQVGGTVEKANQEISTSIKSSMNEVKQGVKQAFSAIKMGFADASKPFTTPLVNAAKQAADKAKLAYTAAGVATINALENVKRFPKTVKTTLAEARNRFMTMIPANAGRRMANRTFYGAQNMVGRARQAAGVAMNPVPRAIALAAVQQKAMEKLSSVVNGTSQRIQSFGANAAKAGQIIMNPVPRAIAMATIMDRTVTPALASMGNAVNGIKSKLSSFGAAVSKGAQIIANPVPRAIALTAIREQLIKSFSGVTTTITNSVASMKQGFGNFTNTIKQSAVQLKSGFQLAGTELKKAGIAAATMVKQSGKILAQSITTAAAGVKGYFAGGVNAKGQTRGQRMASAGNNAAMGLMGLTMAASMAGGSIGEMAQKMMPVTMGLMGLQMVLPMLTSPLGIAILAITALVGSLVWMRKTVDDVAKAAAEAGANMGAAANRMEILQEATGFESPFMRAEDRMFRFSDEDKQAMSEFGSYFESEGGSKFVKELKEVSEEERYSRVASILAQGIANGMDPEKAKAFGQAIASATGDAMLNAKLSRDFANGVFKSGSQAAIDLVRKRQDESRLGTPERLGFMADNPLSRATGTTGATSIWGAAAAATGLGAGAGAGIGAAIGSIGFALGPLGVATAGLGAAVGAVVGTITAGIPAFFAARNAMEELERNVETVAKTFGSSIQVLKEVTNAEQLLLEERRNGTISAEEYTTRSTELQAIEEEQANRLKAAILTSTDAGATQQSIADQLIIGTGMDAGLAGAVARGVDRETVSQQIFGKEFEELGAQQKDVVAAAITETLKGLTPENAAEKLARIETDYAKIANDLVAAAADGLTQKEFSDLAEKDQVANWAKDAFGGVSAGAAAELGFKGRTKGPSAQEQIATKVSDNLMASKDAFEALGISIEEVTTGLQGIADIDLAAEIGTDSEKLKDYAEILVGLEEFENIDPANVFRMMEKEGLTAAQAVEGVTSAVEGVANIKLDKDVFGKATLDAQTMTETLMNAGVALSDIPTVVQENVEKSAEIIGEFGDDAYNKLGNIKPSILPQIIPQLFGTNQADSAGIAAALQSAFPQGLAAISLPIMLQLAGDPTAIALLKNKNAVAAAKEGKTTYTDYVYTPGAGATAVEKALPTGFADVVNAVGDATSTGTGQVTPKPTPTGSGGAAKEDPLQDLKDEITDRLALYGDITKLAKALKKSKDNVGAAFSNLTFGGSIVDKLRKAGISEMMISEILSKGKEFAAKMLKDIKATKKLDQQMIASMRVEQVGTLSQQTRIDAQRATAARKLAGEEGISREEIEDIVSDDEVAQVLASTKKGSKGWREYVRELKAAAKQAAETKKQLDPVGYAIEQIDKSREPILAQFEAQEARFEQAFGNIERKYSGSIQAAKDQISKYEDDIAAVQKDIDALEALNEADQRTIRSKEREKELKQREIEEKEKLNELDQRTIDSLQRQSDIIGRQIEQYERQNEQRQRQIDILNRQSEMISRQIEEIERASELDQRRIDTLSREDEIRTRVSDALSYELDLMSQQEEKIRDSYNKRFEALDKIAGINQRIIDQQKQQIDLSKAISEGDIYAATQAAQQMRASSAAAATDQTRAGLAQGMENQIAGLRTSGGLTREQANAQMQTIDQQSYQTQLAIRDINDQIYQRNLETIPLRDQQLALSMQIRTLEDAIYQANLAVLPLKDQQVTLSDQIRVYEDAIYQRNLEMIPLKDYIATKDKEIRDLQDNIYNRETQILGIQVDRMKPLQDNLTKEQEKLGSLEKQVETEKAAVKIDGLTYAQLQERIDKEKEAYNVQVSQMRLAEKTNQKVGELVDQWNSVAKAIASANRVAQDGLRSAQDQAKAARSVEQGKLAMEVSAAKSEAAVKAAQARYNAALADIDASLAARKAEIEKTQADAIAAAYATGNTATKNVTKFKGGIIKGYAMGGKMKYPTGGFVLGEGSRDSVNARLTPGEYVIRKSMVDKYGLAMMDALNLGSFAIPKYDTGEPNVEIAPTITKEKTINAPVYNTYDMNFNINGNNLNADDVANKVIMKIKQVQSSGIRGNRGY